MNIKQIKSLCDRISFSLLYEDYDDRHGEKVLALVEATRELIGTLEKLNKTV